MSSNRSGRKKISEESIGGTKKKSPTRRPLLDSDIEERESRETTHQRKTATKIPLATYLKDSAMFIDDEFTYLVYLHPKDTSRNRAVFRSKLFAYWHKHKQNDEKLDYREAMKIAKKIRKDN